MLLLEGSAIVFRLAYGRPSSKQLEYMKFCLEPQLEQVKVRNIVLDNRQNFHVTMSFRAGLSGHSRSSADGPQRCQVRISQY